jgi:peptidoglycan hydrolase CwlO-like protein
MALAASAVSAGLIAPQLASSAPGGDPKAEREKVRAEQAVVASQIDVSKASKAQIDDALEALDADLRTQQAALDKAEADLADAQQDIKDAKAAITKLTGEVTALRAEMSRRAIQAYVNPASEDLLTALESKDFSSATEQTFYAELRSQDDADIENRLTGAEVDLQAAKDKAVAAAERAEAKRKEQATRTKAVATAKARQEKLADELQASIDTQIARANELARTDRALSQQIAKEQAELQARLAMQKAAEEKRSKEEAARRAAEEAAANRFVAVSGQEQAPNTNTPAPSTDSGSSGSTDTGGSTDTPTTDGGDTGGTTGYTPGGSDAGIQLAYVQGVPVNAQVAQQVVDMVNAAAADGVSLRLGNSYRSVTRQIELRRQNCGTSYYAIYEMPSGSCRPPTAKPGQSQHQLGLAIDFANCSSRSTACYQWLRGNASRFGYYNLPSEAWHWSTTGS